MYIILLSIIRVLRTRTCDVVFCVVSLPAVDTLLVAVGTAVSVAQQFLCSRPVKSAVHRASVCCTLWHSLQGGVGGAVQPANAVPPTSPTPFSTIVLGVPTRIPATVTQATAMPAKIITKTKTEASFRHFRPIFSLRQQQPQHFASCFLLLSPILRRSRSRSIRSRMSRVFFAGASRASFATRSASENVFFSSAW